MRALSGRMDCGVLRADSGCRLTDGPGHRQTFLCGIGGAFWCRSSGAAPIWCLRISFRRFPKYTYAHTRTCGRAQLLPKNKHTCDRYPHHLGSRCSQNLFAARPVLIPRWCRPTRQVFRLQRKYFFFVCFLFSWVSSSCPANVL